MQQAHVRRWLAWGGVVAVVAAGWLPTARAAAKSLRVAVFMVPRDDPEPAMAAGLESALQLFADELGSVELTMGDALKAGLGGDPLAQLAQCGAKLKCIARLGKRVRAQRVLVVRVGPLGAQGPGLDARFVLIDVKGGAMRARIELELPNAARLEEQLQNNFAAIIDFTPAAQSLADAELPDLEGLELIAPPPPPPEQQRVATSDDGSALASGLLYGGLGGAGLGAILLIAGGIIGSSALSRGDSITASTPLPSAVQTEAEINQQLDTANALFGAGAALAVVGAAVAAAGLVDPWADKPAEVSLGVSSTGVSATLTLAW